MKVAVYACLVIHSVAAFARPQPFWGGGRPSNAAATTAAASCSPVDWKDKAHVGRTFGARRHKHTFLQATSDVKAAVSKPSIVDEQNWDLLSERGQAALARLIKADEAFEAQKHVYGNWPPAGTEDDGKKRLAEQVSQTIQVILCPWLSRYHFIVFLMALRLGDSAGRFGRRLPGWFDGLLGQGAKSFRRSIRRCQSLCRL